MSKEIEKAKKYAEGAQLDSNASMAKAYALIAIAQALEALVEQGVVGK